MGEGFGESYKVDAVKDLLIAGGGPAGLATAIRARLVGLDATVIEPRSGVIDKACGEGLMPPAVDSLQRMGVEVPDGHPLLGIRYVDGDREAVGHFRQGPGRGVRRTALHRALLARADAVGVRRIRARVSGFAQDAGGVSVVCEGPDGGTLRARWFIGADGLHSPTRRRLGLERRPRWPGRYGLRRHYATAPWTPYVEIHLAPGAEAYVTPVSADEIGVAILFSGKARYENLLAGFPALAKRLGDPISPVRGGGPFETRVARRVAGRVLLVGDAAGFLDPLTGEGVQLGLAAAEALVSAIQAGRPARYERALRRLFRRYWWLTAGLLKVRRSPLLRRVLVPLLARAPWIFDLALTLLTHGQPRAPRPDARRAEA